MFESDARPSQSRCSVQTAGPTSDAHLGATLGVLVVSWQNLEGDGHSVRPPVGTESVPDGSMHGVVHHIQAGQSHEGHGPAAELGRKLPLGGCHGDCWTAQTPAGGHGTVVLERRGLPLRML